MTKADWRQPIVKNASLKCLKIEQCMVDAIIRNSLRETTTITGLFILI